MKPGCFAIGLLALLISGCARLHDYGAVMSGNRLHHRGLYEEAAAAYLSVAPTTFGPSASAVLSFDLANVYARLGEGAAASELYARVRKTGLASLSASAWYNEGLLLYEKGRYAEAYRAFRSALELNPGDEDARWNLELAWRDFQRKSALPPERAAPSQRGSGGSSDQELRLLRRLETGRFIPGVQAEPLVLPDDY